MKHLFDIHCHIVPAVDDGAATLEESLDMLRMEQRDGVDNIIITPHYRKRMFETSAEKVHEQFLRLKEAAGTALPELKLYLGCELHSNMELEELLEERKYTTMAGSSYVLLEFSERDSQKYIRDRVHCVMSCGYEPILAHVERYDAVRGDLNFAYELAAMGAKIQVNAGSIIGEYGRKPKKFCRSLMRENLLGFVGSDAHNTSDRAPNIGICAGYVAKKMGEEYARRIFHDNPMEIVAEGQKK